MPQKYKFIIVAAVVLMLLGASALLYHTKVPVREAPDFTLTDLEGNTFNLSDFRGTTVIVDFMATWCNPCRAMTENLKSFHDKNPEIVIISIDIDSTESNEELGNFKSHYNASWIFAIDKEGVSKKYGVVAIPKTVIVNPSGEITFSHTGVISASRLSSEIERAESGGTATPFFIGLGLPLIALLAGVISFFSPCSFPLLPAYMGYYLNLNKERGDRRGKRQLIMDGLIKGVQPALGILVFYTLIGIFIIFAGNKIKSYIPLFEPVVGVILIVLGILMIAEISVFNKLSFRVTGKLSKLSEKARFALFLYGIIYGAAAAGCTMPVFISIILIAISTGGFLFGFSLFLLYVLGMMGLMIFVTLLIALSAETFIKKLRNLTHYIEKIGGVVLVIAGVFIIYYAFAALI